MGIDSVLIALNIVACKVDTKNLMWIYAIISDYEIEAVIICEGISVKPCKARKKVIFELWEKILRESIRIFELHMLKNLQYMPSLHDFLEAMVPGRFSY